MTRAPTGFIGTPRSITRHEHRVVLPGSESDEPVQMAPPAMPTGGSERWTRPARSGVAQVSCVDRKSWSLPDEGREGD